MKAMSTRLVPLSSFKSIQRHTPHRTAKLKATSTEIDKGTKHLIGKYDQLHNIYRVCVLSHRDVRYRPNSIHLHTISIHTFIIWLVVNHAILFVTFLLAYTGIVFFCNMEDRKSLCCCCLKMLFLSKRPVSVVVDVN